MSERTNKEEADRFVAAVGEIQRLDLVKVEAHRREILAGMATTDDEQARAAR